MMDKVLSILVGLAILFAVSDAQLRPEITNIAELNRLRIFEDVDIGQSVFKIEGRSKRPGRLLQYRMESDNFEIKNTLNGVVTVSQYLNYEYKEDIICSITVTDGLESTTAVITVKIKDVNDVAPFFTKDIYTASIVESAEIGTVIVPFLAITDADFTNSAIRLECNRVAGVLNSGENVCDKFEVRQFNGSNKYWNGQLFTSQRLDFEQRSAYQVPLTAYDGVLNTTKSVEVTITDTQDTPPKFTKAVPVTIKEGVPKRVEVNDVDAVDGDFKNPRDISYELISSSLPNSFIVDSVTGAIITNITLDREHLVLPYISLLIKAREIISTNPLVLGDDPVTTATASVQINILDINDNLPEFDQQHYNVSIPETYPSNTAIGLTMNIHDPDIGSAGTYNIDLLNYNNLFAVRPSNGSGKTAAGVTVLDSTLIDYETMGPTKFYVLIVTATEKDNATRVSTATVTVHILDVNDNNPSFGQANYTSQVREDALMDTLVFNPLQISDPDTGTLGKGGIKFTLIGSEASRFKINPDNGQVLVADCRTPGVKPCIDYETKRNYTLTAIASDENGAGRRGAADLLIVVIDVNDNTPRFSLPDQTSYIDEGAVNPNPTVTFSVSDRDTVGGPIKFTIPGNNPSGQYWTVIGTQLKAIQPIRYDDTPSRSGKFIFPVIAYDTKFSATATVTINVREANNYSPRFDAAKYEETIDETTIGLTPVLTVKATDNDPKDTPAGTLDDYKITEGSQGKFVIHPKTGVISTAQEAIFNAKTQSLYSMIVSVSDRHIPRRVGKADVYIHIRDTNNEDPYMDPQSVRIDVSENTPIGKSVKQINGLDPDTAAILRYRFAEPISALTTDGVNVDRIHYDYTTRFTITNEGEVRVNADLDRDRAQQITYSVVVTDIAANPIQSGTGTLIVNILEYNEQAPEFQAPWTVGIPEYNISVPEELPIGWYVRTLFAQDEDDEIDHFELKSKLEYFDVSESGAISISKRIDYDDDIMETQFEAVVYDTGNPQLSASATIFVKIVNINDNSPVFIEDIYQASIPENSPGGTYITQVEANDDDKEDYGVVRYALLRSEGRFIIDPINGRITVANGAVLDREKTALISVQVQAYDSPLDATVRRFTIIPLYITLLDENDNDPKFNRAIHRATIIETIPQGRIVTQLTATDADIGLNANLTFVKVPNIGNDTEGFFNVDEIDGRITVTKILLGKTGIYTFDVEAIDQYGTDRKTKTQVIITVLRATNSPPIWVIPSAENMTLTVLEEQYKGMIVYKAKAIDHDEEEDGRITYGFYRGQTQTFTDRTDEFRINRVTGVIRAQIRFDRETVDSYRLWLVARDSGEQYLESTRLLLVSVKDVNDHLPRFPMVDGKVVPKEFFAKEGGLTGTETFPKEINRVQATDADIEKYATVHYAIVAGNDDDVFSIGESSGIIYMNREVDREVKSEYNLVIKATNDISDATVIYRKKREEAQNVISVTIKIQDVNDQDPVFSKESYYGCVNADAKFEQSIVTVEADDKDAEGSSAISFSFKSSADSSKFLIHEKTGIIANEDLMRDHKGKTFNLVAVASDDIDNPSAARTAQADVKIFVTDSKANGAKLVVAQPATEVRLYSNQIQRVLSEQFGSDLKYVCILSVKDHVITEGDSSQIWSDVFISAANSGGQLLGSQTLVDKLNDKRDAFGVLHVKYAEPAEEDSSIFDETPVLIVLILVAILIFLALLMMCLACYCIYKSKNHRLRKQSIDQRHLVSSEETPVIIETKPIEEHHDYDNAAYVSETKEVRTYSREVASPEDVDITPAPVIVHDDAVYVADDTPETDEPVYTSINKSRQSSQRNTIMEEQEVEFRESPVPTPPSSRSPSPPRYSPPPEATPPREDSPIMRRRTPSPEPRPNSDVRDSFIINQSDVIRYH